jgi:hypothetical protein
MKPMKRTSAVVLVLLTLGLAACGGGDDGWTPDPATPSASDDVPASATASSQAYVSFAASLPKSETGLGLDISKTTPPTSETAAPSQL